VHLILPPPLYSTQSQTPEAETSFAVTNIYMNNVQTGKSDISFSQNNPIFVRKFESNEKSVQY
jgi:hypothetical protein